MIEQQPLVADQHHLAHDLGDTVLSVPDFHFAPILALQLKALQLALLCQGLLGTRRVGQHR